jgi:hypothetical protein
MPKKEINYSKTVMYKIVCNDLTVKDLYVGSTTDFTKRKSTHKSHCNNESDSKYNLKVYKMIRENGGWDNWTIVQIEAYPCNNNNETRARERHWYEMLHATMNSIVPVRTQKQYRIDNKVILAEKQNTNHVCNCGGKYTQSNKARHEKSTKHVEYINNK